MSNTRTRVIPFLLMFTKTAAGKQIVMVRNALILLLAFAFSAMADCSPKLRADDQIQGTVCDSINARRPDDRMIFAISLKRSPGNEMDSAHLAQVKVYSEDLFSKYDLRSARDTASPIRPPLKEIEYGYDVLIRAGSVDSIVNETYVAQLFYRYSPVSTGLLIHAGKKAPQKQKWESFRCTWNPCEAGIGFPFSLAELIRRGSQAIPWNHFQIRSMATQALIVVAFIQAHSQGNFK